MRSSSKIAIRNRLFTRILILVSLLIAFIISVNTFLAIRNETAFMRNELVEKHKLYATLLGSIVKSAFRTFDWFGVNSMVARIRQSDEVLYIRILKPDGEIYLADDEGMLGTIDPNPYTYTPELSVQGGPAAFGNGRTLWIVNPVPIGKDTWHVVLALSLKSIEQARNKIILHNTLEGILVMLIGLSLTLWLSRSITRPIGRLLEGTRQVSSGNLDIQIAADRQDEIGKLAGAFNQMTRDLKEGRDKIEAHRRTLEQRVAERTGELLNEIGERRQAETALRQSEEKYRTLFHHIEDMIVIFDQATRRILDCNQAALQRYEYTLEELLKLDIDSLNAPLKAPSSGDAGSTDDEKAPAVAYHVTRGGDIFPVEVQSKAVTFQEGQARMRIIRDISERKVAEDQRKQLEVQLRRAQKMEVVGMLAGGVAHDLNNILSALVGYPELLLLDLPQDSRMRKPMETIKNSGEKAATIVQDLLTLARRGVAIKETVDLNSIISEYLNSPEHVKLMRFHPGIRVQTLLESELNLISGSPVHLAKSVMNLITNAAEAMPEGGTIHVATRNQYIDKPIRGYTTIREGDYVRLTVRDGGVGIARKDIERIFEPFYTKKMLGRSGTGLGMAVVWGTIDDHQGYIDVISQEGKGTTFELYFPVTKEQLIEKAATLSIEDYTGNGESILVVDDVPEQREIAVALLERLNYTPAAVASGEEALDYLQTHRADLILLDMIMDPGIDGTETYRRILEIHPGQKAIITSGFSETDRVKEAQRLGAGTYVKKPYTLETIGVAIKKELPSGQPPSERPT